MRKKMRKKPGYFLTSSHEEKNEEKTLIRVNSISSSLRSGADRKKRPQGSRLFPVSATQKFPEGREI